MNSTRIKVRGYHCDAYGHVNNARYLEFLEEGRWVFLQPAQDNGMLDKLGLLFVVVNINISYKAPVVPNDWIEVLVTGIRYNNMSIVLDQEIRRGEQLCSKAEINFVLLHIDSQKPVVIDERIRSLFEDLMHA